ncbi:hypothetical protein L1987_55282 [Smallanthus sonchifolius]|uniref:Uncharacterized protein n=1 Tax=Smallanthus sonchifolius TaxID=185202 RepID=A0ACB9E9U1_9ASTR|nr:hypothetical protein L1987_55282 [Smallanthus sonchifolius]
MAVKNPLLTLIPPVKTSTPNPFTKDGAEEFLIGKHDTRNRLPSEQLIIFVQTAIEIEFGTEANELAMLMARRYSGNLGLRAEVNFRIRELD